MEKITLTKNVEFLPGINLRVSINVIKNNRGHIFLQYPGNRPQLTALGFLQYVPTSNNFKWNPGNTQLVWAQAQNSPNRSF